jgi:hypothetical protein
MAAGNVGQHGRVLFQSGHGISGFWRRWLSIIPLSADSQPPRIRKFRASPRSPSALPDISGADPGNTRKAHFPPGNAVSRPRQDFIYQGKTLFTKNLHD